MFLQLFKEATVVPCNISHTGDIGQTFLHLEGGKKAFLHVGGDQHFNIEEEDIKIFQGGEAFYVGNSNGFNDEEMDVSKAKFL